MKNWVKGGLIGFAVAVFGVWMFLIFTGHSDTGWKCSTSSTSSGSIKCNFVDFLFSPIHWAFVLIFSLVGFVGGAINAKIINKINENISDPFRKGLKITSAITITLILIFGIIRILAFNNWVKTLVYVVIFTFVIFVAGLIVEKVKYRGETSSFSSKQVNQNYSSGY